MAGLSGVTLGTWGCGRALSGYLCLFDDTAAPSQLQRSRAGACKDSWRGSRGEGWKLSLKIYFNVSDFLQGQAQARLERVQKMLAKLGISSHDDPGPSIRVEHDALHIR